MVAGLTRHLNIVIELGELGAKYPEGTHYQPFTSMRIIERWVDISPYTSHSI